MTIKVGDWIKLKIGKTPNELYRVEEVTRLSGAPENPYVHTYHWFLMLDDIEECRPGATWTEAPPKRPGWYWWQPPDGPIRIVHIYQGQREVWCELDGSYGRIERPSTIGGRFSGPLCAPPTVVRDSQ